MMDTILEVPEVGFETARKIVQQQLVLILHAHRCQQKELVNPDHELLIKSNKKCELPFCQKTKNCLDHIRSCYEPESCMVPHCQATREIIKHWKSCNDKNHCTICKPIFRAQIKNAL